MGANGRAHVIAFVAVAAAVLALSTLFSVSLALGLGHTGFGGEGALDVDGAWQLVTASAAVAALSGALALLAAYLVRRPT